MNRKNLDISANISKFVLDFIESNKDKDNLENLWNSKKIQKEFNSVVNKKYVNKDKPKKCKSNYIYFCEDYRKIIEEKYPNISKKDIMSKLGIEWKEIKENNKEEFDKYQKLADEDKERYMREMEVFKNLSVDKETRNEIEKPKRIRQTKVVKDEPKQELEAVKELEITTVKDENNLEKAKEYFIKKKTKKMKKLQPELNDEEILKRVNKKWDKLSDEDKKSWLEKSN